MDPAKGEIKEMTIEAVVTRADGTVENLGVVSHWKRKESFLRRITNVLGGH